MVDNDNMQGFDSLARMIETVRALPRAVIVDAAPEIADVLRDHLVETIESGTTPDGVPWEPRRSDERKPLRNAAAHVFAGAVGSYVLVRVTGVEARHHTGRVKGGVKRQIIYTGTKLPPAVLKEIRGVVARRFAEHMRGAAA